MNNKNREGFVLERERERERGRENRTTNKERKKEFLPFKHHFFLYVLFYFSVWIFSWCFLTQALKESFFTFLSLSLFFKDVFMLSLLFFSFFLFPYRLPLSRCLALFYPHPMSGFLYIHWSNSWGANLTKKNKEGSEERNKWRTWEEIRVGERERERKKHKRERYRLHNALNHQVFRCDPRAW